jgi:hypothetical protein
MSVDWPHDAHRAHDGPGGGIFELDGDLRNLDVEEAIAIIAHRDAPLPTLFRHRRVIDKRN